MRNIGTLFMLLVLLPAVLWHSALGQVSEQPPHPGPRRLIDGMLARKARWQAAARDNNHYAVGVRHANNDTVGANDTCRSWIDGLSNFTGADLAMITASGGSPNDLGNYDACVGINGAHYCVATFDTDQYLGMCGPKYCTPEDMMVDPTFQAVVKFLAHFPATSKFTSITCLRGSPEPVSSPGQVAGVTLLTAFAVVAVTITATQFLVTTTRNQRYRAEDEQETMPLVSKDFGQLALGPSQLKADGRDGAEGATGDNHSHESGNPKGKKTSVGWMQCFSLPHNVGQLFAPVPFSPGLRCLDGMRVISILWVILGHTFLELVPVLDIGSLLFVVRSVLPRFTFQVVINAVFAVDSFFLLSGFLGMYLALKHFYRTGAPRNTVQWAALLLTHRYLRLTPLYAVCLVTYMYVLPLWGSGPLWGSWQSEDFHKCFDDWWTNMLYVNNLVPNQFGGKATGGLGCMGWSWYLANDFQLFLLLPPLAVLQYHAPKKGYAVMALLVAGCVAANGALVRAFDLRTCEADQDSQAPGNYQTVVYNKPYTRATPYVVGMALAAFYHDLGGEHHTIQRPMFVVRAAGLVVALILLAVPVFSTYGMRATSGQDQGDCEWEAWQDQAYLTLHRVCWSLGLAYLVLGSCLLDWNPWVARFLGLRFWSPLSQLTYGAYLVHLMVLISIAFNFSKPILYSDGMVVAMYLGVVILAFALAFVLHVVVERPMLALEKMLMPRSR